MCIRDRLRHPQVPQHRQVAGSASSVPHALHPDVLVLDQPGRTILCLRHRRPAPTQRPPHRPGTRSRHPQLGQRMECEPEALHLDQARGTDPRIPQTTSTANYRRRTLVDASRTVATVYAGGPNGAPHAVATGLASEKFAAVVRRNWPNAQRVSRVDSRIDFGGAESDSRTWDILYATVVAFARERGLATTIHGDFLGSGEAGRTLYVGSPKSEVRLRLYEKSKEVRAHSRTRSGSVVSDWVRVEVEVKPRKRTARQRAATAS